MEGIIGLLILGFCVWMILRHPLKSLSLIFKVGFLLVLGFGAFLVLWWVLLTVWQRTPYRRTDNQNPIYNTISPLREKSRMGGVKTGRGYRWNFPLSSRMHFYPQECTKDCIVELGRMFSVQEVWFKYWVNKNEIKRDFILKSSWQIVMNSIV